MKRCGSHARGLSSLGGTLLTTVNCTPGVLSVTANQSLADPHCQTGVSHGITGKLRFDGTAISTDFTTRWQADCHVTR